MCVENEQVDHVAVLRRRLADLEHEMYFSEAGLAANPKAMTPGDVEVSRWRRAEVAALVAAIAALDGSRRAIPLWLYALMLAMSAVALLLAGVAIWTH